MKTYNANRAPLSTVIIRMMIDNIPPELQGKLAYLTGHPAQRLGFYSCLTYLLAFDKNETDAEHKLRRDLIEFFTGGLNLIADDSLPRHVVRLVVDGDPVVETINLDIPCGYEEQ